MEEGLSFSQTSENIRRSTAQKLQTFEFIRGKQVDIPFWDIVVITALDEGQKHAYDIQLRSKLSRGELPLGVEYHVFYDPPGPKIGNGGSVLVTIGDLLKIYGEERLKHFKILMLPAGGYSQRLPNASVLGKAFTSLPYGDPPYQMLEMQLAMFIEFPGRMEPGIFVVASDCFELFNSDRNWCFSQPGFTALAHPSPIEIGTTHGVFVLGNYQNSPPNEVTSPVIQTTCSKFLHKPSKDVMRKHGITFFHNNQELVYTDSVFYMDWTSAKKLHDFCETIQPIDCEIDAYGDFLQALGTDASVDYTENVANVVKETSSLITKRKEIFHLLKGTQLNVLLLNESKFYHIGTTKEYIHHFCLDSVFRHESHFKSEVMVKSEGVREEKSVPDRSCLIHCFQKVPSTVGQDTVVEYCAIGIGSSIGHNCIVSNVEIPPGGCIPDATFMTTVSVVSDETKGLFVTVVFGVDDNVKKTVKVADIGKLSYFGSPLDKVLALLDIKQDPLEGSITLWQAKLFPVFRTCKESVLYTLEMLKCLNYLKNGNNPDRPHFANDSATKYLSMEDVLACKDVEGTLDIREKLRKRILET